MGFSGAPHQQLLVGDGTKDNFLRETAKFIRISLNCALARIYLVAKRANQVLATKIGHSRFSNLTKKYDPFMVKPTVLAHLEIVTEKR